MCFVRQRVGDAMVLTTYGRSSGFCIDPIEKKPLNHFFPGSSVFSFGTAGCNLACKFCQNWDISKSREMDRLLDAASPERIAEAARASGAASVAFTYNDPVIFAEYAMDTADACHALGLHSVAVTAGYMHAAPQARVLRQDGRGQRRPEGLHRGVLLPADRRPPRAGARHAAVPAARDRLLARDHDAADPGAQRQQRRDRRDDTLDRRAARARRAAALHGVPSRTTRCWTWRRRRLRPCRAPARSRSATVCTMSTPATSTTSRAARPFVRAATKPWCGATGTSVLSCRIETREDARGTCPHCGTPIAGRFGAFAGGFGRRRVPVRVAVH